ncbi:MAG: hypothetical protein HRT45_05130 [Bdellovibrionales bacterium]|nr:hypothetical protein [Bdellovibrionales bacterium]
MTEGFQRHQVALFFYFALQDEKLATQATVKALQKIRKRFESAEQGDTPKPASTDLNQEAVLVAVTQKIWNNFRSSIRSTQSAVTIEGGWLVPEGVHLGPWREFRKESAEDEFLILLWSKVLKFSDQGIANGLNVSTGTVRYRVGSALRVLGRMVKANG